MPPQNITVLGCTWGLVLGSVLARNGHQVQAWDFFPEVVDRWEKERCHPKLPGFRVPESIVFQRDLKKALTFPKKSAQSTIILEEGAGSAPDCVLEAVTTKGIRPVAAQYKVLESEMLDTPIPWIFCSKGIEEESLLPVMDVARSVWQEDARTRSCAALSGPSFAAEVALGRPTTVCAASQDPAFAQYVQRLFMCEHFRVYTQDDVLGVELGGAVKNVIAIASGVSDGLGLGDNTRAALITRGLAEIMRLGEAMGARAETFAGLTGMGDLVLTCCGTQSRNYTFGKLLAEGRSVSEALEEVGMVVEGMRTAHSVWNLAQRHQVEMPIVEAIYRVLYADEPPQEAVQALMARDARPESDGALQSGQ